MVGSVDSSNRNHGEQALCVYPGRPERFLIDNRKNMLESSRLRMNPKTWAEVHDFAPVGNSPSGRTI
ncbi:predicted protein [Botrytis cinerea T4]|uniref:Uncharacterized protein n=1 Tax=Botryotinia fuckeliana (strain T4) TaxID=999810 RepID=G2YQ22_BOTF4|nr:predicted protein [Botrytis cinerea T4]